MISRFLPRDGRYYILANHVLLVAFGFWVFHFQRHPMQLVIGLVAALAAESFFSRFSVRTEGRSRADLWLSASVTALSLFLLVNSPNPWFYGYGGIVAIASKYLLRIDRRNHIFNPTNVAIVFLLALLPPYNFRLYADEFSLYPFPIVQVLIFGLLATVKSDRWMVAVSYMGTVALGALFIFLVTGRTMLYNFGPEISAAGLTFIWLMITDPKTTPQSRRDQFIFGASVGALALGLKQMEIVYHQFISLFVVSAVRATILAFMGSAITARPDQNPTRSAVLSA